jgi:DNA primase small subunit
MGILDDKQQWDKVLAILPDSDTREVLNEKWEGNPTRASGDKWDDLVKEVDKTEHKKKFKDDVARDIQFQYCYPRLDDKVSTNINHLLKSPFCVHPKTCKIITMTNS